MSTEPSRKRAIAFIDGQNLFHAAREAIGYGWPNYDVLRLSQIVCRDCGGECKAVNFYTGIPERSDNAAWNHFWQAKLGQMGTRGVEVFSRPLRYRNQTVKLPDGKTFAFLVGQEKGVDVRIALDIVRAILRDECDVALVFSQDQDLSEVAEEIRELDIRQFVSEIHGILTHEGNTIEDMY